MEQRDLLLSSMHEAQAASGRHYLQPESLRILERRYRLSKAELRGLASYYSMYSLKARGRHLIKVCDSPVCRMLGSGAVLERLEKSLGIREGQTDAHGAFTLERCQCLGHCADAPLVSIDEQIVPAQDERVLQARIEALKSGDSGAMAREGGRHGD